MALVDPGADRGVWRARGNEPIERVKLAEACVVGDVLGYDEESPIGWKRALAAAGSVIQGKRVALESGVTGEAVEVSKNAVVVGYSGGTPGAFVYVAEGTDYGKITETIPTDSGDADMIVGVVLTASVVAFMVGARPESVAA